MLVARSPVSQFVPGGRTHSSIPVPTSPLIGREDTLEHLTDIVRRQHSRLVTMTGPGGIGKTRLVLDLLPRLTTPYEFVELSSVQQPHVVMAVIARALDISFSIDPLEACIDAIGDNPLVLVLDTFEHLMPAAADLETVIDQCPQLQVIVTSRIPLDLANEVVVPVGSLDSANAEDQMAPDSAAVQLFVARAKEAHAPFQMLSHQHRDVVEICSLLAGNPLAIELAAARSNLFAPSSLLHYLQTHPQILATESQSATARFSTVTAALGWSLDLLSSDARELWIRFGSFVGDFSMDAVMGIAESGADAVDLVGQLITHHLVVRTVNSLGEPRFRLLDTAREYAAHLLLESGSDYEVRERLATWYLERSKTLQQELMGPEAGPWQDRIAGDLPNIRGAIAWLKANHRVTDAMNLFNRLQWFWTIPSYVSEGRVLCEELYRARDESTDERAIAGLLDTAGVLADWQRDTPKATEYYEASLEIWTKLGDADSVAKLLVGLGSTTLDQGEFERSRSFLSQAYEHAVESGNHWAQGGSSNLLGLVAAAQGQYPEAQDHHKTALHAFQQGGFLTHTRIALNGLGFALLKQARYREAMECLTTALDQMSETTLYAQTPDTIENFARIALAGKQFELAIQLLAAGAQQRAELALDIRPFTEQERQLAFSAAQQSVRDATYARNWERGMSFSLAESFAAARQVQEPQGNSIHLSKREKQVLQLIVNGASDGEIADQLFISRRTASKHVAAILAKLEAPNRTAATRIALRDGLV